jgi:GNAT superfamily N-acetyltransferase
MGTVLMGVRPACLHDAHAIAEVHTRAWQVAYRGLMPDAFLDSLDPVQRAERWREIMGTNCEGGPDGRVAEIEGIVRGFCWFGPSRDDDTAEDWELYAVYVHPSSWRTGLGTALVSGAVLQRAPSTEWTVWSLSGSKQSSKFYSGHGFRRDGTTTTRDFGGSSLEVVRRRRRAIAPSSRM